MALTQIPSSMLESTAQYTGFKNRIINGAMVIDQRNAGASVTPAGVETYTVDRFSYIGTQASKFTFQQNAGSVTPPTGFKNYLGFTVASAVASPASTDQFAIYHKIEGLNSSDLDFGLSTAATVTVSFWVRSSLTGTFSGGITNSAGNRSYVFNYTISSANTWEQKAVTITGDTSGTWLTTNGIGIQLRLDLGSGPNQDGTASAWQAADKMRTSGSVRVVSTAGATFYITGVQLEKGSTATSFDYRPYGTELALCQRYYQNSGSGAINNYPAFHYGTGVYTGIVLPVVMRASPTVTGTGQALTYFEAGNTFTLTGGVFDSGTTYVSIQYTSSGGTNGYAGTFKPVYQLSAEL